MSSVPRRRRPISPEKQGTVNDAMVPGAFRGRVPIVAPVTPQQRQDARARGITAVANPAARGSQIDQFTLSSAGAQSLSLSYLPILKSWNVELNGVKALNGTDYTISGQTLNLLSGLDARTGDVVQAQYDYLTGMPSSPSVSGPPLLGSPLAVGNNGVVLPTGAAAGDFAVLFVALDSSRSVTLNGWTEAGTVTVSHAVSSTFPSGLTYTLHTLTKVLTGSTDVPTFSISTPQPAWGVAVFNGSGGVADYKSGTVADGTTGTNPALTAGATAVRCWVTLSNATTLTAPGRLSQSLQTPAVDVDLLIGVETNLSSLAATSSGNAGWLMAAVGSTL